MKTTNGKTAQNKRINAMGIALTVLTLLCAGMVIFVFYAASKAGESTCAVSAAAYEQNIIGFDFVRVNQNGFGNKIAIYKHTQTGVYYMFDRSDGGMCVILDADGKPYVGDKHGENADNTTTAE